MDYRSPAARRSSTRSALVHDFFIQDGGAERCAIELARLLPTATVHTTFFDAERFGTRIDPGRVRTWPLQRVLGATPRFRALLPLYPAWFSLLDLRQAELVVSSSVAFPKAVRTSSRGMHISYVYTPMRYAWDLDSYLAGSSYSPPARLGARTIRPLLRMWDRRTGRRPDVLVAISNEVRGRIRRLWGRDAMVIYPPVDTDEIALSRADGGFYLVAARLLAYRRIDVAIQACRLLGRELVVVGDGPEKPRLEQLAAGAPIRFLGQLDRPALVELFRNCRAYLLPGVEDFGIAPLEAAAAGKPTVALRASGALETVQEDVTGVFFDRPDGPAMAAALEQLDDLALDPQLIRAHAELFDRRVFVDRWRALLRDLHVAPELYA
jgi:glycosyltransferase involved in cell wall biosynthesis